MGGLIADKPEGYYGREVSEGRNIVFRSPPGIAPEGPSAIAEWSLAPDNEIGAFLVTIRDLPSIGDAVYFGDGGGRVRELQWRIDGGEPTSLGLIGPGTALIAIPEERFGEEIQISVGIDATAGSSWSGAETVIAAGVEPSFVSASIEGAGVKGTDHVATWAVDGRPMPVVAVRWLIAGVEVATGSTYDAAAAGDGDTLVCEMTATSSVGTVAVERSIVITVPIVPVLPDITVAIGGGQYVGDTLTATITLMAGTPAPAYGYRWQRDGVNIVGAATASYVLVGADSGATVRCVASATNAAGAAEATSAGVSVSTSAAPTFAEAPGLSGTGRVGDNLNVAWIAAGNPAPAAAVQWQKDGADIVGETGSSYTVLVGDIDATITARVTITNVFGSAAADSEGVVAIPAVGTTPVTVATAVAFASAVVAYDGATDTTGLVTGATVNQTGSKSAEVYLHVPLTATTGIIFTGAVANGPFSDDVAIAGTGIAVVANGASTAYVPTEGGFIAYKEATWTGEPTSSETRVERATDAGGTDAATYTPSGGAFPANEGGKYDRIVSRATGYGVPADPGYIESATAWTEVADQPVLALAPDAWLLGTPSVVSSTVDQMDTILTLGSLALDGVMWSTGTPEYLDGRAFPAGWEAVTPGTPVDLVRVYYDGATATDGFVPGASISVGEASGTLYRHASLTPTTGALFFEGLVGSAADNSGITCSNGSATANGAKATVSFDRWLTAPAVHGTPPFDYRRFRAGIDDLRRTRVKLIGRKDGVWSPRSFDKTLSDAPAPTSSSIWSRWTMRKEGQFLAREIGGSGMQYPRSAATTPAMPGLVFSGIDVTRPTMSRTFGEWWVSPRMRGMFANMSTMGTGVDRQDSNRLVAYSTTGPTQTAAAWNARNGIYLSLDGGETAVLVLSLPDSPGSNRGSRRLLMHCLAQAPGGVSAAARTWYCVHPKATWSPDALVNTQVYRSTDGCQTWTPIWGEQAGSWLGEVYGIECRINGSGHDVYVWGEKGIKRRADGASAWSNVTGISGNVLHVETTEEGHVYAIVAGNGLYKSTDGVAFSRILQGNYHCFAVHKAKLTDGHRRIFVSSHKAGVNARWSDDTGATWTHANGGSTVNNIINSLKFEGQTDDFSHNPWGESVFFIPHETDPDECLMMRKQHMGRLVLTEKDANGNYQAIWSSRGFDYSRAIAVSWGNTYKDVAFGATDRVAFFSDHGPNWTHSLNFTDTLRTQIHQLIEGTSGKFPDYQGGGPLILENNGHKRMLVPIGEGKVGAQKAPVVCGPQVESLTARRGSAGANIGALTSLVMPKGSLGGTYTLRCTTAAADAGTFTLYAPAEDPGQTGGALGTTDGNMGAQTIGGITFSLSNGSSDYAAGSNPSEFTWYYNPIGDGAILTGASSIATFGRGARGQRNPTDASKGCTGRNLYSMDASANVTQTRQLPYEFSGYSDGNVIWGLNGDTIMRSPNEGQAWETAFAPPGQWSNLERNVGSILPSTHDNQRVYRANDAGQVHRIDNGGATLVFDYLAVMAVIYPGGTYAGAGSPNRPGVKSVTEDPADPNLLHVAVAYGGHASVFRSTVGGGAATAWVDVTAEEGLLQDGDIHADPNGEIVHFTQHGTEVLGTPSSLLLSSSTKKDIDRFNGDAGDYVGV